MTTEPISIIFGLWEWEKRVFFKSAFCGLFYVSILMDLRFCIWKITKSHQLQPATISRPSVRWKFLISEMKGLDPIRSFLGFLRNMGHVIPTPGTETCETRRSVLTKRPRSQNPKLCLACPGSAMFLSTARRLKLLGTRTGCQNPPIWDCARLGTLGTDEETVFPTIIFLVFSTSAQSL